MLLASHTTAASIHEPRKDAIKAERAWASNRMTLIDQFPATAVAGSQCLNFLCS
ncbi:hypothetical protein ALP05_01425 [Pseudomonas caricapapayae]|uniref:Uncharacterized protein n=1 Tax=Pseudomonas caricapapayae TaxID=46678 RepID=A0A3M6EHN9_9PSED|nr:hypothetical protein ALP05_01425 [Pseudomonas caricapapayae]